MRTWNKRERKGKKRKEKETTYLICNTARFSTDNRGLKNQGTNQSYIHGRRRERESDKKIGICSVVETDKQGRNKMTEAVTF